MPHKFQSPYAHVTHNLTTNAKLLRADCMNAAQISIQLSPLNLLSLLKSSLKQISLHETSTFSIWVYLLEWEFEWPI